MRSSFSSHVLDLKYETVLPCNCDGGGAVAAAAGGGGGGVMVVVVVVVLSRRTLTLTLVLRTLVLSSIGLSLNTVDNSQAIANVHACLVNQAIFRSAAGVFIFHRRGALAYGRSC